MINGIDEKSERGANEMMKQHDELLKQFGGKLPDFGELQKIEDVFPSMSNALKKKISREYYEAGKLDEAIEALQGVPKDDETRELHRMFRYADEARGIVSNVDPETQKYFVDLAERLGIKVDGKEKENGEG